LPATAHGAREERRKPSSSLFPQTRRGEKQLRKRKKREKEGALRNYSFSLGERSGKGGERGGKQTKPRTASTRAFGLERGRETRSRERERRESNTTTIRSTNYIDVRDGDMKRKKKMGKKPFLMPYCGFVEGKHSDKQKREGGEGGRDQAIRLHCVMKRGNCREDDSHSLAS